MTTILLVEDEQDYAELFSESLALLGVTTIITDGYNKAVKLLSTNTEIDAVISDFDFGSSTENGFQMANYVVKNHPEKPIAMISAMRSDQVVSDLSQLGVYDFLKKPVDNKDIENLVESFKKIIEQNKQEEMAPKCYLDGVFIGKSEKMAELKSSITKLSKTNAPVLIRGESGVGKELVATSIHNLSSRSDGPMINVNCGAFNNESLIESLLFGYKKGAFTGADKDKQGLIAAADKGTLFLDEIGELPLSMQASLLRVLQEKKVRAIGDDKETSVDFRLIAATHKDLEKMVENGEFRQDLYYRIDVTRISVPALRDRGDDVLQLCEHLIAKISAEFGVDAKAMSAEFKKWIVSQKLEGNVRELQNIISKALVVGREDKEVYPPVGHLSINKERSGNYFEDAKREGLEPLLENIEREILEKAMGICNQKHVDVAKLLHIDIRALRYKLKKFNIGNVDEK
ncbi:TPA: sigma-54-dependent transcriptional regulator [Acinetobacter baumannii]|uniref:sigma-54-dependent transcriptional regulator n=1 Tax=Acinetobacter baumannii TaxID=470 RepID=UPI0022590ACF|nr:sigma-54 dependent transcriptional regulator [Acinetobacter baumannii]MCX3034269.1 sigma-54 dependent transcriptional regulator [Acinetobacter baumannii]